MSCHTQADAACREISGELVDVICWLSGGDLTADEFRHTVAALEDKKLRRHGFRLFSDISGNVVHFSLRFAQDGELCASVDVDPRTGVIEIQRTCA